MKTKIFEKKANFPLKKDLPKFSRIIIHEQCQARICKGSQYILPILVQMMRSFLWELSGRLKKKTFQSIAVFTVTKVFLPIFPRIIECDRAHGTLYKGLQYILTVTVEVIR